MNEEEEEARFNAWWDSLLGITPSASAAASPSNAGRGRAGDASSSSGAIKDASAKTAADFFNIEDPTTDLAGFRKRVGAEAVAFGQQLD